MSTYQNGNPLYSPGGILGGIGAKLSPTSTADVPTQQKVVTTSTPIASTFSVASPTTPTPAVNASGVGTSVGLGGLFSSGGGTSFNSGESPSAPEGTPTPPSISSNTVLLVGAVLVLWLVFR